MPLKLKKLYVFFLIIDSKDIKDKQLTVIFNIQGYNNNISYKNNAELITSYYFSKMHV